MTDYLENYEFNTLDFYKKNHGLQLYYSWSGDIWWTEEPPSGTRNETFHGGYIRYPDHPVITWTHEETPKGIFYYGHKMVESFVTANT